MTILFTGGTDFMYNRVRVLVEGLRKLQGIELDFMPIASRMSFDLRDFNRRQALADFIYIPPFRHINVRFIKHYAKKPVVFDPLISKYLTKAIDYGHFWKAPIKYFLDKIPFSHCDILLADTQAHKDFFAKKFNINLKKIFVLPIGADTSLFASQQLKTEGSLFQVGFYGSFVPLQGVPKIVEAAHHLSEERDIIFKIIGDGYDFKKSKRLATQRGLKNIDFLGSVAYNELGRMIDNFDMCLGIFGDSLKTDVVIPNKIYHYAAMRKCTLTKDTLAIRELFTPELDIAVCDNNPKNIAENIYNLKKDTSRRLRLADAAHSLIANQYNEVEIAKRFVAILESY